MCVTDSDYGPGSVSVFSHSAAQSYSLLCECVPTVRSQGPRFLQSCCSAFPVGRWSKGDGRGVQRPCECYLNDDAPGSALER